MTTFSVKLKRQCHICKNTFDIANKRHIYFCAKKNHLNISRQEIQFNQICFESGISFTKDLLTKEYILGEKSLPDLKKMYGLAYRQIIFLLKYFDIQPRTASQSLSLPTHREKYKKTCLTRYGCDNVSKAVCIKDKKKETSLSNYGVDNIWKKRDFIIERMISKYGKKSVPNINGNANSWGWKGISTEKKAERILKRVKGSARWWESLSDDEKNIITQKKCSHMKKTFASKLEERFQRVLSNMGVGFSRQKWIKNRSFDFHITGTRILIEINGDYWHANPEIYTDDMFIMKYCGKTAKEVRKKDYDKTILAEKYGYKVIVLWEIEMSKMTDAEIATWIYLLLEGNSKEL